jgi:hypothetical protein
MRLGVWQRIGVVASVVFFSFQAFEARSKQLKTATLFADSDLQRCSEGGGTFDKCHDAWVATYNAMSDPNWFFIAVEPALVIALCWAACYAVVYTAKWVLAGSRKKAE